MRNLGRFIGSKGPGCNSGNDKADPTDKRKVTVKNKRFTSNNTMNLVEGQKSELNRKEPTRSVRHEFGIFYNR